MKFEEFCFFTTHNKRDLYTHTYIVSKCDWYRTVSIQKIIIQFLDHISKSIETKLHNRLEAFPLGFSARNRNFETCQIVGRQEQQISGVYYLAGSVNNYQKNVVHRLGAYSATPAEILLFSLLKKNFERERIATDKKSGTEHKHVGNTCAIRISEDSEQHRFSGIGSAAVTHVRYTQKKSIRARKY